MEALGIDLFTLVVQIVNFILLLLILRKVLYKPLLKAISDRQQKLLAIEEKEKDIEGIRSETEQKRKTTLQSVQEEKERVLKETQLKADLRKKDIIEKANTEARDIIKKAVKEAEKIKTNAIKENEENILSLATSIVEKVLEGSLDENSKNETVKMAVKKLSDVKF